MEDALIEKTQHRIADFFISSSDYNGIPLTRLSKEINQDYLKTIEIVKALVETGLAIIQSNGNPHIISRYYSKSDQIDILNTAQTNETKLLHQLGKIKFVSDSVPVCIYPSTKYLEKNRNIDVFKRLPYTCELALAGEQLSAKYFDIEVLERYSKDPRFSFSLSDYSGEISYGTDENEEPPVSSKDKIFLKSFGLGMDRDGKRVVVVYLRYLKGLTENHQIYWQSYENNNGCLPVKEYFETSILGMWETTRSVYNAFIDEQKALNDLSILIVGAPLFNATFEGHKRPQNFTFLFIPTLKNYNDFVLLLDKMISENVNKNFFKKDGFETLEQIRLQNGLVEKKEKGTLRLFEDWLSSKYHVDASIKDLFDSFKKIRKERQHPAHKIINNNFDSTLLIRQREIITEAYYSMKYLRLIFHRHPKARTANVPDWLDESEVSIY